MRTVVILLCLLSAASCSTKNTSDFSPGEIQSEHGWRQHVAAETDPWVIEDLDVLPVGNTAHVLARMTTLDTEGHLGSSIEDYRALDPAGRHWERDAIVYQSVDSSGYFGSDMKALASGGRIYVCFNRSALPHNTVQDGNSVRFAMRSAGGGWSEPVDIAFTGESQFGCNIVELVSGPAILYVYSAPSAENQFVLQNSIRFVHALDHSGSAWSDPATAVERAGAGRIELSAAVIAGNPAAVYPASADSGSPEGSLAFVRADDPLGTVWGVPQTLDVSEGAGDCALLENIAGSPAVYYRVNSQPGQLQPRYSMQYLRSLDALGQSWDSPRFLGDGNGCEMVSFGGLPVVTNTVIPQQLQLGGFPTVRSRFGFSDDGSLWSEELVVGEGPRVIIHALGIVNGRPAVAYAGRGTIVFATFYN